MKHFIGIFMAVGIVALFIAVQSPQLTGLAFFETVDAHTLDDAIHKIVPFNGIAFPSGTCTNVAQQLYSEITRDMVDVQNGFVTEGPERVASINFVTERLRRYGTVDIVAGPTLLHNEGATMLISINIESLVTVPKRVRANYLAIDLYGYLGDVFYVDHGRFSTPSLDCIFVAHNNEAYCECDAHTISNIEVAGITSIPDETSYEKLLARVGLDEPKP